MSRRDTTSNNNSETSSTHSAMLNSRGGAIPISNGEDSKDKEQFFSNGPNIQKRRSEKTF